VPDSYAITMSEFMDTEQGHGMNHDPKKLDVKIKVGWVKAENRLYFLYEAYKGSGILLPGLHQDIFEVVVDGDLSGGPLIDHTIGRCHSRGGGKGGVGARPPYRSETASRKPTA